MHAVHGDVGFALSFSQDVIVRTSYLYVRIKEGCVSAMVMGDYIAEQMTEKFYGWKQIVIYIKCGFLDHTQSGTPGERRGHPRRRVHTHAQTHMHACFPTIFSHISETLSCFS